MLLGLLAAAGCEGTVNNDAAGGFVIPVTVRQSLTTMGVESQGGCYRASISADGRHVVFGSFATNLAPVGVATGLGDIYVRDLDTGLTELVSVDPSGQGGNALSTNPSISGDGTIVAFQSAATNLVPGTDTNAATDIFVRNRTTGTTLRVSRNTVVALANGDSRNPSISVDGRFVAFESDATNLDGLLDTNGASDIFVAILSTGDVERVSRDAFGGIADGGSHNPSISGDGHFVAYESDATNLVTNDTNGIRDIFVTDRVGNRIERVSVDTGRLDANGASRNPSISADGHSVAFESDATDLTTDNDNNNSSDIFVRDRVAQVTVLVSRHTSGALGADASAQPAISGDGQWVVFLSDAPNLVDDDTNTVTDAFVRDLATSTTFRVSVRTYGVQPSDATPALSPSISGQGRWVAFISAAQDMSDGDTNGATDVFVRGLLH